jgi:hypothetical protein
LVGYVGNPFGLLVAPPWAISGATNPSRSSPLLPLLPPSPPPAGAAGQSPGCWRRRPFLYPAQAPPRRGWWAGGGAPSRLLLGGRRRSSPGLARADDDGNAPSSSSSDLTAGRLCAGGRRAQGGSRVAAAPHLHVLRGWLVQGGGIGLRGHGQGSWAPRGSGPG